MLAGFGNGLADAAWSKWKVPFSKKKENSRRRGLTSSLDAWIGNMANPNEVLGFLHAFYGLGAVLSPLIATTMITKGDRLPWYSFYYVMVRPPL